MRLEVNVARFRRRTPRFCAGAAVFGLALSLFAHAAAACIAYQPFDPDRVLERLSREQIAMLPEVIVEGVVEPYDASKDEVGPRDSRGVTTMRVERVLKGDVESSVVLLFNAQSADCTHEPPFGQRIRFAARVVETREVLESGQIAPEFEFDGIELSPYRQALLQGTRYILYYRNFDIPLDDPALNAVLEQRQAETKALQEEASVGGLRAELSYAAHLAETNETHRALDVYEAAFIKHPDDLDLLLTLAVVRSDAYRNNEPEATLAEVERRAPKTEEWRGKIIRTRFAATGELTPGWRDWTELKPTRSEYCKNREMSFDGASFDRSDLAGCDFLGSSFRHSSFLGADLRHAYFAYGPSPRLELDASGAKYDCATKFPEDFDPAKEGMINVEGSCGTH
jgi:hypothetical protein